MAKSDPMLALQAYALGQASRQSAPSYVKHEHHEHRAPTDESVKLLKEMESAARDKVVASITLTDNALSGEMVMWREYHTDHVAISVVFSLNGQRFEELIKVPSQTKPDETLTKIRDQVAARIAVEIIRANDDSIRGLFMRPPAI